ncbi:hypothetical protein ACTFIR_009707 [Dictyostelium discoideum]
MNNEILVYNINNNTKKEQLISSAKVKSCIADPNNIGFMRITEIDSKSLENITKGKDAFISTEYSSNNCTGNYSSTFYILDTCFQDINGKYKYYSIKNNLFTESASCIGGCLNCTNYPLFNISNTNCMTQGLFLSNKHKSQKLLDFDYGLLNSYQDKNFSFIINELKNKYNNIIFYAESNQPLIIRFISNKELINSNILLLKKRMTILERFRYSIEFLKYPYLFFDIFRNKINVLEKENDINLNCINYNNNNNNNYPINNYS